MYLAGCPTRFTFLIHQKAKVKKMVHCRRRRNLLATATAVMALAQIPSPAVGRGVTVVRSAIQGAQNHFPAGLFRWYQGKECGKEVDYCGVIDFCTDGLNYGYANYGEQCQPFNGPTIRLAPGKKYKLTLRNTLPQGNKNNTSNLHTHGLHIVGSGDGDDVTREVQAGECMDYIWDIGRDHPGGTHWYHAHMHGLAEKQVGGGAFGMIIVEDNPRINPDVPMWAKYERVLQIFSQLGDGNLIVNGVRGPTPNYIQVEGDRWFRLRVSAIDWIGDTGDFEITGCQYAKIASDGIWSSVVPMPQERSYSIGAASRADFAVRCPSASKRWPGVVRFNDKVVAVFQLTQAVSQPYALQIWEPSLPPSLQGIKEAFVPPQNTYDITMTLNTINGRSWDPLVPLHIIQYDEVHEWTIHGSDKHPFHKHLYHMLVVSPGGCGQHKEGEFYDTIAGADSEGSCRVRFRAADFGQRELLHCHSLPHSDFGAMAWVNVVGTNMPRNDNVSPARQCMEGYTTTKQQGGGGNNNNGGKRFGAP